MIFKWRGWFTRRMAEAKLLINKSKLRGLGCQEPRHNILVSQFIFWTLIRCSIPNVYLSYVEGWQQSSFNITPKLPVFSRAPHQHFNSFFVTKQNTSFSNLIFYLFHIHWLDGSTISSATVKWKQDFTFFFFPTQKKPGCLAGLFPTEHPYFILFYFF